MVKLKNGSASALILLNRETGGRYTLPVLPINGEVAYTDGSNKPQSLDILDLGSVDIPGGTDLDTMSFESFFPARHDPGFCCVTKAQLKPPKVYRNTLSNWKDGGVPVQVIYAAGFLNKTMYIKDFSWRYRGAEGDIYYTITLVEYRKIAPRKVASSGGLLRRGVTQKDRPPATKSAAKTPATGSSYKVKSGDTLAVIAKKNKTSVSVILKKNPSIKNPNKISVGQVIKL